MEGLIAADGERIVKRGWLMLGGLVWASPLCAQAAPDPLAPLSTTPPASQVHETVVPVLGPVPTDRPSPAQPPIVVQQTAPPPRTVAVPKDWRGVFDAIDSGNWASAQAGIAALPQGPLA